MARDYTASSTQYHTRTGAVVTAVPLTIACWFQVKDTNTSYFLCSVGNNGAAGRFSLNFAGNVANDPLRATAESDAGTVDTNSVSTSITANTWHFGAAIFATTTSRYVQIDTTASTPTTGTVANPTADFTTWGALRRSSVSNVLDGKLAECALWNVALTADELATLAGGACALFVRPSGLVSYAPFMGDANTANEVDWLVATPFSGVNGPVSGDHPPIMYPRRRRIILPAAAVAGGTQPPRSMHQFRQRAAG